MSDLTYRIADALMEHRPTGRQRRSRDDHMLRTECQCGHWEWEHADHQADEVAAVVHPEIRTISELDALPEGSVVLAGSCSAYQRDGEWWFASLGLRGVPADDIPLPGRLLWTPGGEP